jgi:adenosylcobinamide kinase / adenosylcobinamide-phosphate guanylyltransferase
MTVSLVIGGARSGKSRYSESKVKMLTYENRGSKLHYVATAIAIDEEMEARIEQHQLRRSNEWEEHEIPVKLSEALKKFTDKDIVLVDCLTVWLNNVIYNDGETLLEFEIKNSVAQLIEILNASQATIVLVSNEVGLGVVPMGKETRLFVDHAGWMNQKIAAIAENVIFVAAGIPLALKGVV